MVARAPTAVRRTTQWTGAAVDHERTLETVPARERAGPADEPVTGPEPAARRPRRAGVALLVVLATAVAATIVSVTLVRTTGAYHQPDVGSATRSHGPRPDLDHAGPPAGGALDEIPGASLVAVGRELTARFGMTLVAHAGIQAGQVNDPTLGLEVRVSVFPAAGQDSVGAVECAFIGGAGAVDDRLLARAGQCVMPAVPAKQRAAISAWLLASGATMPVGASGRRAFGPVWLAVSHTDGTFVVALSGATLLTAR